MFGSRGDSLCQHGRENQVEALPPSAYNAAQTISPSR
jgi:hypothetical protein